MALLKNINYHEKDQDMWFDEEPHIYYVKGKPVHTSVTTFIKEFFPKFDAKSTADKMYEKYYNSEGHKYYQMTPEMILKSWSGNEAATLGTKLHKNIEYYWNKQLDLIENSTKSTIEWVYFENFVNDNPQLIPYRTEWEIFDLELNLAGSIDITFLNDDGTLDIGDWKRSKEIKLENNYMKDTNAYVPIEHLPNANYWTYAIQLNMYKYILEKNYGKKINKLHLYIFHNENKNKNYMHFEVPILSKEIEDLCSERIKKIKNFT